MRYLVDRWVPAFAGTTQKRSILLAAGIRWSLRFALSEPPENLNPGSFQQRRIAFEAAHFTHAFQERQHHGLRWVPGLSVR